MILWTYNGFNTCVKHWHIVFRDCEPGLSEYAYEAWERMTDGGARVQDYAPFLTLTIEYISQ